MERGRGRVKRLGLPMHRIIAHKQVRELAGAPLGLLGRVVRGGFIVTELGHYVRSLLTGSLGRVRVAPTAYVGSLRPALSWVCYPIKYLLVLWVNCLLLYLYRLRRKEERQGGKKERIELLNPGVQFVAIEGGMEWTIGAKEQGQERQLTHNTALGYLYWQEMSVIPPLYNIAYCCSMHAASLVLGYPLRIITADLGSLAAA